MHLGVTPSQTNPNKGQRAMSPRNRPGGLSVNKKDMSSFVEKVDPNKEENKFFTGG